MHTHIFDDNEFEAYDVLESCKKCLYIYVYEQGWLENRPKFWKNVQNFHFSSIWTLVQNYCENRLQKLNGFSKILDEKLTNQNKRKKEEDRAWTKQSKYTHAGCEMM